MKDVVHLSICYAWYVINLSNGMQCMFMPQETFIHMIWWWKSYVFSKNATYDM